MKKIIFILLFILVTSLMFSEFYYFKSIDTWIQVESITRIEPSLNGFGRKSGITIHLISKGEGWNVINIVDETEISIFLNYIKNRKGEIK